MKHLLLAGLFAVCYQLSFGQTEMQQFRSSALKNRALSQKELGSQLENHNFSSLFTHTDNSMVYGFIGNNYQRIRIRFISVSKSSPDTYAVAGKSMVKNNVCDFQGAFKISNIRKYKNDVYGVDNEYKNKGIKGEYIVLGEYTLSENHLQNHSGVFKGVFKSGFYLDKNDNVKYDDIESNADGYTNIQFVGQWTAYKGIIIKRCNWGDFRIPGDGDFDWSR